ncbi:hypothetical protein M422DRAFT_255878 [Sphaerobolus stellatus SS14]|uniref:Alpha-type protein kinase domain-containing protein n=1 Tax=Sphaerobolus stellatus (strain SS14) TaxID=990650 RepID=A0A0C9UD68_SPHS4|nr:hypothetical protein M422DRAFT_255878 [Sphaerobolus stellatus SS14]
MHMKAGLTAQAEIMLLDETPQCNDCGALFPHLKGDLCGECRLDCVEEAVGVDSGPSIDPGMVLTQASQHQAKASTFRLNNQKLAKLEQNRNLQKAIPGSNTVKGTKQVVLNAAAITLSGIEPSLPAYKWLEMILQEVKDRYLTLQKQKWLPTFMRDKPLPSFKLEDVELTTKATKQFVVLDMNIILDKMTLLSDLWDHLVRESRVSDTVVKADKKSIKIHVSLTEPEYEDIDIQDGNVKAPSPPAFAVKVKTGHSKNKQDTDSELSDGEFSIQVQEVSTGAQQPNTHSQIKAGKRKAKERWGSYKHNMTDGSGTGGYLRKGIHKYCFMGFTHNEKLALFQSAWETESHPNITNKITLEADLRAVIFAQYWLDAFKQHAFRTLAELQFNAAGAFLGRIIFADIPNSGALLAPLLKLPPKPHELRLTDKFDQPDSDREPLTDVINAFTYAVFEDSEKHILVTDIQGIVNGYLPQTVVNVI